MGISKKATKTQGNIVLELDGRPAFDVFSEAIGSLKSDGSIQTNDIAHLGLAVKRPGSQSDIIKPEKDGQVLVARVPFVVDKDKKILIFGGPIPSGIEMFFCHRTVDSITKGAFDMIEDIKKRLNSKKPSAILAFECFARTAPFLGTEETDKENKELQKRLGPNTPWLGTVVHGELSPCNGTNTYFNYTYPIIVFV